MCRGSRIRQKRKLADHLIPLPENHLFSLIMTTSQIAQDALDQGQGILRLAPNWVPRSFCVPGRRIKLHPDDYYALGGERGGIDERWFSSTTPADNGPLTGVNEGLSMVVFDDGSTSHQITLRDAIGELKGGIIGDRLWNEHQKWPVYSKFFDNKGALPHHRLRRGHRQG